MEFALLIAFIIVQVGFGVRILLQDVRSWAHRVFAGFMLVNVLTSLSALLRLVATDVDIAAALIVASIVARLVWNATFIVLGVVAIFYREWIERRRALVFGLSVGLIVIGTLLVWGAYGSVRIKSQIVESLPGTQLYCSSAQVFPVRAWVLGYHVLCIFVALGLLINVIVRRQAANWQMAIWMALAMVVVGAAGLFGSRMLQGSLRISVPALSGSLFSLVFGYIVLRYRLFSARNAAVALAFERLDDGVVILNADLVVLSCNQRAADLLGIEQAFVMDKHIDLVLRFSPFSHRVWNALLNDLQGRSLATSEVDYTVSRESKAVVNRLMPVKDGVGVVRGYLWLLNDVTEQRATSLIAERRAVELQEALRELQATNQAQGELLETIRRLSALAVPVLQGIIVLPLSGQINSDRAELIMDNLLTGIREHQARVAIIDITGVPNVDTSVANYLIRAARAGALMGCRAILVGIRPEMAQVIVELGIDMQGLRTFSDLQSGVEYALRMLGVELTGRSLARV